MLATDQVHDFVFNLLRHSRRHIYLVDDRNDFQVVLYSHIEVRDGLSLHSLSSINHQKRSLASSDGTGYLVREVNVSRSINKIENVCITILCLIFHLDGMALDSNATLSLQVHIIKHLTLGNLNGLSLL